MQQVALEGEAYKNEVVDILGEGNPAIVAEELGSSWGGVEIDATESEAAAQELDIKSEGTVGSKSGEAQTQTEDGNAKDDKAKASDTKVEAQEMGKQGSDGGAADEGKRVKGKLDPLSFARDILESVRKGDCPPAEETPESCGMVDLVKETDDLKLHQQ